MKPPRLITLSIELREIQPRIWRRFRVAGLTRLGGLHTVIQKIMGWTDSHLHAFEIDGQRFGIPDPDWPDYTRDETPISLSRLIDLGVERFSYEYDFGDRWWHEITIEHVTVANGDDRRPLCLGGERAAPPEDCGGVGGYEKVLETLFDPRDPEFDHLRRWVGSWQPEAFDLEAVNQRLRSRRRLWMLDILARDEVRTHFASAR